MKFEVPKASNFGPRTLPRFGFLIPHITQNPELRTSSPGYPVSPVSLFSQVSQEYLIVRWLEVARWAILPGDRRLLGLFDEATQIYFRCTEQLRFAALYDSGQQNVERTIHP